MPKLDHRISAPIPNDSAESIQYFPVSIIAQPPAMTAAVETVSPISWRKALRTFTSRPARHSNSAMTPFMTTPAAATPIIVRAWTSSGFCQRLKAS